MDSEEKSGQFKSCYCILNATGVKETDEPGDGSGGGGGCSDADPPPSSPPKNPPDWENERGGGGTKEEGRGINLRGGGNRSFLPSLSRAISSAGAERGRAV